MNKIPNINNNIIHFLMNREDVNLCHRVIYINRIVTYINP